MAAPTEERGHLAAKMNRFERRAMNATWGRTFAARVQNREDNALIQSDYSQYRDDPVGFFRDVLKIELWEKQAAIANAIVRRSQVAAKTGHKIGKSLLAAGLCLWWVCTRANATVVVTAPSEHQIKGIIWKELRILHKRVREIMGGGVPLDPRVGIQFRNGNEIKGLATNTPERVAGLSGKAVFVVIDEASGYEDRLYEALETSTAGGDDGLEGAGEARLFAIGNPTRTAGWFFDIFRTANVDWERFTVSSEESPNVLAANDNGVKPIPGLATREFIDKLRRKYGPNPDTHPIYMVRVKGLYPERASNSIIALTDVDLASSKERRATAFVPSPQMSDVTLGVDVARFGDDDSAIVPAMGQWMGEGRSFSGLDGVELAAEVMRDARDWIAKGYRVRVNVDGIGVGASCVDALKHSDLAKSGRMIVCDVQAAARAIDEKNYINLRSQMWFDLGSWLAEGGSIPDDSELQRQLLAPTYAIARDGRIQVEGKEDMKKKMGKSPDMADAACLAVYQGRSGIIEFTGATSKAEAPARSSLGRYNWRKAGGAG